MEVKVVGTLDKLNIIKALMKLIFNRALQGRRI